MNYNIIQVPSHRLRANYNKVGGMGAVHIQKTILKNSSESVSQIQSAVSYIPVKYDIPNLLISRFLSPISFNRSQKISNVTNNTEPRLIKKLLETVEYIPNTTMFDLIVSIDIMQAISKEAKILDIVLERDKENQLEEIILTVERCNQEIMKNIYSIMISKAHLLYTLYGERSLRTLSYMRPVCIGEISEHKIS